MTEVLVIDASLIVDLVAAEDLSELAAERLDGAVLHAPAHMDAEVLSALGRLHRAGEIGAASVRHHLVDIRGAPIQRHSVAELMVGAWKRRGRLRLADALYVELAELLGASLLTTDRRLARAASIAELVA